MPKLRVSLWPLVALGFVWPATAAITFTPALAPATSAIQKIENREGLRLAYEKAAALGNTARMSKLLRDNEAIATELIVFTAEAFSRDPGETLAKRYALLSEGWDAAFDSDFPVKFERYLGRLKSGPKEKRKLLRESYEKAVIEYAELLQESENKPQLLQLADKLKSMGGDFESLGDSFHASQSYLFEGNLRGESFHGDDADLHRVADAYSACVRLRESWSLRDRFYKQVKPVGEALVGRGYGAEAKAKGEAPGAAPKESGTAIVVPLAFKEIDALKDRDRPNYYLDEHRQIWPTVNLQGTGSSAKIPRISDGPTVIRESSAKIMVDQDGDGAGDVEWPTRGKYEQLTVELGDNTTKRSWSVLTEVGRQDDLFQGTQFNLLATDSQYLVYFIPASAVFGEIAGTRVQIFDDNIDGQYGSWPQTWAHQGLTDGVFQPEVDSIRIGKEKKARPYSEYLNLGQAGWFKVEMKDGGGSIAAQPTELKTGTVQLKGKGIAPDFFILKGIKGDFENTYIDVSGGKKVSLPVGKYELYFGLVSKGKGFQRMKAVVLPGPGTPRYEVEEGENLIVNYGQPYAFDFAYEADGAQVTVKGSSIRIVGAGGETYDRFYNCVPLVEASVRKAGGKRAAASVDMRPVVNNSGVEEHGWSATWKPIDGTLEANLEEVEVQVTEKKNKLFGKVTSPWK